MHKRTIKIHVLVWLIWYFITTSWAIFSGTKQPPIPLAYNLLSLIAVFYTTRWVAGRYWRFIEKNTDCWVNEKGKLTSKYPATWKYYIFRWPVAGVLTIVLGYIGLSWIMDGLFVQWGLLKARSPNFYFYTYSRWVAESIYICAGNVMAAIEYHLRIEKEKREVLEDDNRHVREMNTFFMGDVRDLTDKLQRNSDELRNRLDNGEV
jgi:hypothetical protein